MENIKNRQFYIEKIKKLFELIDFVDLENYRIRDENAFSLVPKSLANKYKLVPIGIKNNLLVVAMSDPNDMYAIDDLRIVTGYEVKVVFGDSKIIAQMILKHSVNEF